MQSICLSLFTFDDCVQEFLTSVVSFPKRILNFGYLDLAFSFAVILLYQTHIFKQDLVINGLLND